MDFPFSAAGNIVGAGLSYIGGMNALSQQNSQFNASMQMAQQQLAFQQAAATQGVRWRVADAQAAGISPLVALGAPTFNPGAASVFPTAQGTNPFSEMPGALGRAGQDISAAVGRTMTQQEKEEAAFKTSQLANQTRVTDAQVNNLNAQANFYNARAMGTPPFPSVGSESGQIIQGQTGSNTGVYKDKPAEITTATPTTPGFVAGRAAPADQMYWTKEGLLEVQPAQGTPASQGDVFNSALHFMRNRLKSQPESDPGIMAAIRQRYPDAVSYRPTGFGYFRPVFPDEEVRIDVRREKWPYR